MSVFTEIDIFEKHIGYNMFRVKIHSTVILQDMLD